MSLLNRTAGELDCSRNIMMPQTTHEYMGLHPEALPDTDY